MNYWDDKDSQLAALFTYSPDAVLGFERGRVVFANAAAERLFGRRLRGETLTEILPELENSLLRESGVTAADIGGTRCPVTIVRRGEVSVLTILRAVPTPERFNAALVSHLRAAAFTLRFSLEKLTESRQQEENARVAWHSYYTLQHLIGRLSDAQSLSRGDLPMNMRQLDLAALVRDLTDSTAFFRGEGGAVVTCEIEPGDYIIRGDADRLEQLVLILLGNSLQHTPAGGHIRVTLSQSAARYILSVDDDGEGMDGEMLAGAFSLRGAEDPAGSGTGLGLYIAWTLARAHGGTILAQSEPGSGTRMRVTLPRFDALFLGDAPAAPPRGPERILTELSTVLPSDAYDPDHRR